MMAQDKESFGFDPVEYRDLDPVDSVLVMEMVDLKIAANLVESDYQTLKALNPALIRWATPPEDSTWLILPDGSAGKFIEGWANVPPEQKKRQTIHVVKHGETLAGIARKYRTTVSDICGVSENKKLKPNRLTVGQEIIIPVAPDDYKESAVEYQVENSPPRQKTVNYKVRRGDNLTSIARKFGTTVSAVKKENNLYRSSTIHPGQTLVIRSSRGGGSSEKDDDDKPIPDPPPPEWHKVQKGETMSEIASKYGLGLSVLQRANPGVDPKRLKVGQKLKLPTGSEPKRETSPQFVFYTVRRGDTIGKIAQKYGVSETKLLEANDMNRRTVIHPGQKIKIPQG